jgi:hypothetical protein
MQISGAPPESLTIKDTVSNSSVTISYNEMVVGEVSNFNPTKTGEILYMPYRGPDISNCRKLWDIWGRGMLGDNSIFFSQAKNTTSDIGKNSISYNSFQNLGAPVAL